MNGELRVGRPLDGAATAAEASGRGLLWKRLFSLLALAATAAILVSVPRQMAQARGLWEDVGAGRNQGATPRRQLDRRPAAADRQLEQRRVEQRLRGAVSAAPADFTARRELAELLASMGQPRAALSEFEAAIRLAPTPVDEARMWFRLANELSRVGDYARALDAYERQLALGATDPAALINSAELLMAEGRTSEAVDRYREGILLEEREPARREHVQGIAAGYFGLAVALDRAGHPLASREAMGRALALDPGLAILRTAARPDSDLFFVPAGDVSYYLALARLAQGRPDDAAAAFRDYLATARAPALYLQRAREQLAGLMTGAGTMTTTPGSGVSPDRGRARPTGGQGRGLSVVHHATVFTKGPLVAPMIDAAFAMDKRLLAACLSDLPTPASSRYRLSLELRIEDTGRVGAARVTAPTDLGEDIPRCIEDALLTRFRVTRPGRRKPTQVRMELVLAPSAPGGV